MSYQVFISYKAEQREFAEAVARRLTEQGVSVWWDTRLLGGDEYARVIERAIDQAECVLVLWSSAASESTWVRSEMERAGKREVLVPVLLDQHPIMMPWDQLQHIDLAQWDGASDSEALTPVLEAVRARVSTPLRLAQGENAAEQAFERSGQEIAIWRFLSELKNPRASDIRRFLAWVGLASPLGPEAEVALANSERRESRLRTRWIAIAAFLTVSAVGATTLAFFDAASARMLALEKDQRIREIKRRQSSGVASELIGQRDAAKRAERAAESKAARLGREVNRLKSRLARVEAEAKASKNKPANTSTAAAQTAELNKLKKEVASLKRKNASLRRTNSSLNDANLRRIKSEHKRWKSRRDARWLTLRSAIPAVARCDTLIGPKISSAAIAKMSRSALISAESACRTAALSKIAPRRIFAQLAKARVALRRPGWTKGKYPLSNFSFDKFEFFSVGYRLDIGKPPLKKDQVEAQAWYLQADRLEHDVGGYNRSLGERDPLLKAEATERAVALGSKAAKGTVGVYVFYGFNGRKIDKNRGEKLMRENLVNNYVKYHYGRAIALGQTAEKNKAKSVELLRQVAGGKNTVRKSLSCSQLKRLAKQRVLGASNAVKKHCKS